MANPTSLYDLFFQKQIDSIAHSTAKVNLWDGAVRAGKTMASLVAWLMYVANAPSGGDLVMVGKTIQTLYRNIFVPLMNPDLFGPIAREVKYTQGAPTARVLGRIVHVVGANDAKAESKIRGFTCAGAYVDEATLIPKDFWMMLKTRLSVQGSRLFATTNPDNPTHWLRKSEMIGTRDDDVRHFHFQLDDNVFLDPDEVARLKRSFSGLYHRRFILGEWVLAEGAVYDMWDESVHVVDELPAISEWVGLGVDYGTTNPFAGILLGLGADNVLYAAAEYYFDSQAKEATRKKTDSEYFHEVEEVWMKQPCPEYNPQIHRKPIWRIVDPSAASYRALLHQNNIPQFEANNDVLDGIRLVGSLLSQEKLKVHRRCTHLIDEIPAYSWDDKAAEKGEDKPIKVADHSPDALRYVTKSTQAIWGRKVKVHATT
jgi:PBSX family phage terminase large subunit